MLIAREFVAYLSRQVARRLSPTFIETSNSQALAEITTSVIVEELEVEDRLNDEVRDILGQYSDYMRQEGVSYQEMFRRIKNTLITQRKVIRAAGRDSGDQMKLSRDKINDLSHKIVAALRKSRDFRLKRDPNDVRLEMVKIITELLQTEEKVEPGEWFYTSGDDRVFPKGIPAGQVKVVRPGSPFQEIFLEPSGLQNGLEEVLIVLEGVHQQIPDLPTAAAAVHLNDHCRVDRRLGLRLPQRGLNLEPIDRFD